ncbi:MAG TPA: hypothetical protein VI299_29510 [Polyangiales bacterium]
MDEENHKGPSSAFATLSELKQAWRFRFFSWFALARAKVTRDHEPKIRERTFLHHASWVRVPAAALRYPTAFPSDRAPRGDSLLFLSYFTDDLLDYLRGFTEKLSDAMDALWYPTTEWEGAASYGATKRYVLNHRWRTDVYFNGRQNLNVGDARVALATRRRLDELAALLDTPDHEAFARVYEEAVRTAFGKQTRFASAHDDGSAR